MLMTAETTEDELRREVLRLMSEVARKDAALEVRSLIAKDLLDSVQALHGDAAVLQVAAHAKRMNRAREHNVEIDALEKALSAGKREA